MENNICSEFNNHTEANYKAHSEYYYNLLKTNTEADIKFRNKVGWFLLGVGIGSAILACLITILIIKS